MHSTRVCILLLWLSSATLCQTWRQAQGKATNFLAGLINTAMDALKITQTCSHTLAGDVYTLRVQPRTEPAPKHHFVLITLGTLQVEGGAGDLPRDHPLRHDVKFRGARPVAEALRKCLPVGCASLATLQVSSAQEAGSRAMEEAAKALGEYSGRTVFLASAASPVATIAPGDILHLQAAVEGLYGRYGPVKVVSLVADGDTMPLDVLADRVQDALSECAKPMKFSSVLGADLAVVLEDGAIHREPGWITAQYSTVLRYSSPVAEVRLQVSVTESAATTFSTVATAASDDDDLAFAVSRLNESFHQVCATCPDLVALNQALGLMHCVSEEVKDAVRNEAFRACPPMKDLMTNVFAVFDALLMSSPDMGRVTSNADLQDALVAMTRNFQAFLGKGRSAAAARIKAQASQGYGLPATLSRPSLGRHATRTVPTNLG